MSRKFLSFLSVLVAILGIGAPIAWDYWSNLYTLTLYKQSENVVLSKESKIPGLKFEYLGKPVESLNTTRFQFQNSGNKFIDKSDVVKGIEVKIDGADILDIKIVEQNPKNLNLDISKLSDNSFGIAFELLNPNDFSTFDIVSSGSIGNFKSSSRIKKIDKITDQDFKFNPPISDRVSTYQWVAVPASIIFLLLIWKALRGVVVPVRSSAYWVKDELEKGFDKEKLIPILEQSTDGLLMDHTKEKIQSRLDNLDDSNEEELEKFKFDVYIDLLNQDIGGSAAMAILGLIGLVLYNIASLAMSLMYV